MVEQLHVPYRSIPEMFLARVAQTPQQNAFGYPTPAGPAWLTWAATAERARAIAAGLVGLGVSPEDRVAIAATTRLEWVLADLGIMCAGAATTTVYPTSEPKDAEFILSDSASKVLIAEDADQVHKLDHADLPELRHMVVIDGPAPADDGLTLADLEAKGRAALAQDPHLVERIAGAVRGDQLATLIYTSGTTGTPKGVELLHSGWCWQGAGQASLDIMRPDDLHYLWLPLSHSFGKALLCGVIFAGVSTYVDGRVDKLVDNLATVRPTLMCGAPRMFEKVYNKIVTSAREAGGLKWRLFQWAFGVGAEMTRQQQADRRPSAILKAKNAVADKLVFGRIRRRLGGRIRILVSGSAPLNKDIQEFFHAAGLVILEGYGLTETSAAAFVNRPLRYKFGTVGQAIGDLAVRIADDGEIEIRGTPVMRGYRNLPEETAAAFTPDGYLRTGDIGQLDADGFLRITDRKKDLIKTSGGKYVAPSHIEGLFKTICPYVSQALAIGQGRNYVSMLITLDADTIKDWAAGGPLAGQPYEEIVTATQTENLITQYVLELNQRLNRWETVKRFTILPRDLSVERGELTPSLKVRRKVVEAEFADEIEAMYDDALASAPHAETSLVRPEPEPKPKPDRRAGRA